MMGWLPVVGGLCLLLAIAVASWRLHMRGRELPAADAAQQRQQRVEAPRATPAQPAVDTQSVLRRQLHAMALGDDPLLDDDTALPAEQQAVMALATNTLSRMDLSPRYTPRRPHLLPQLIQSVNDADASARSMAAIIAQDPALAGNLLRIANSPVYRLQARPVDSIERAVTLVGNEGIRQIISAALVQPVMSVGGFVFPRFSALIWDHAMLASAVAADHARTVEHEDVFAAQLLGLVQGLGAVVVMQVLRDSYAAQVGARPDARVAVQLLERWDATTAARIAVRWELPERHWQALHAASVHDPAGGASTDGLARSLRFAQMAATLQLRLRNQAVNADQAVATLEQAGLAPAHAVQWLWGRMQLRAEAGA